LRQFERLYIPSEVYDQVWISEKVYNRALSKVQEE
jgi:hypothetical protein